MSVGVSDEAFVDSIRERHISFLLRGLGITPQEDASDNTATAADAPPWTKQGQPARATPLSRFLNNVDIPSSTTHPTAHTVFSARCEVTDNETCLPKGPLSMTSTGSCLALAASVGPMQLARAVTSVWLTDSHGEMEENCIETGLGYAVDYSALDDARSLVFYADKDRIKSFNWDDSKPIHTMRSGKCEGPLSVFSDGKLARAGRGCAVIWNLDNLETHGESGTEKIGKGDYRLPGSVWRHPFGEVESSIGSTAHTTIKFAEPTFEPVAWHLHKPTSHMLCAEYPGRSSGRANHEFASFDLTQGKTVTRYKGFSGEIPVFSTSDGDPNMFATGGSDGYARLYDIRQTMPQHAFDIDHENLDCYAVALAHPDGIPILFTGGTRTECISLWDLRSNKVVYELATGNNGAVSFAWDAQNATLYASTACEYVDIMGVPYGYRPYKPPKLDNVAGGQSKKQRKKKARRAKGNNLENDTKGLRWPEEAYHSEDYFGHAFDAGQHRLYRYRFKDDPDLKALPQFGKSLHLRMLENMLGQGF